MNSRERVRKERAKDEERLRVVTGEEVSDSGVANLFRSRERFESEGKRVTMRVAKLFMAESPDFRRLMVWSEPISLSLEKPSRMSYSM